MLVDSINPKGSGPHPAIERINGTTETLRLGMLITNLNGIDYMIPILGVLEGGFNYTSSVDDKRFELLPTGITEIVGIHTTPATWEQMCGSAVASGAFPVAFRPRAVDHAVGEYGAQLPDPLMPKDEGKTFVDWGKRPSPRPFAHSDGGVLQNQPLGIGAGVPRQYCEWRGLGPPDRRGPLR